MILERSFLTSLKMKALFSMFSLIFSTKALSLSRGDTAFQKNCFTPTYDRF